MTFPTNYEEILRRIDMTDPVSYAKTRNFIDGAVTYLSPYISRGVISTRMVMEKVLAKGYRPFKIEKFLQELAWRDYWQQIWIAKGELINDDLKHPQPQVENHEMPAAILNAQTGIQAIDKAIHDFYEIGYIHNHVRMYIASIACNIGRSHWKTPARWMYFHLLDGDWASNALSWQWVAGSNSNKKYYANQDNINRYCHTRQSGTFLDMNYSVFETIEIPDVLTETLIPKMSTPLPESNPIKLDKTIPTLVYNIYNLDPEWKTEITANRILLLEPSVFQKYPVSGNTIQFALQLAENIKGLQIFTGEFNELTDKHQLTDIYYKEHPLNKSYSGNEEDRDWMFSVKGYFPSFFAFWKRCRKELKDF